MDCNGDERATFSSDKEAQQHNKGCRRSGGSGNGRGYGRGLGQGTGRRGAADSACGQGMRQGPCGQKQHNNNKHND